MMKFPDFTHGLDKEVSYQVLKNFIELSFEVRNHFQNNPVLLLHWDDSIFMFLKLHMQTRKGTLLKMAPGGLHVCMGCFASPWLTKLSAFWLLCALLKPGNQKLQMNREELRGW